MKLNFSLICQTLVSGLLVGRALSQECVTNTLTEDIPTNANISLRSYSYCAGRLNVTAYVANLCYNKLVTLYYSDGDERSTPLSAISINYNSSIPNSNWEFWSSSVGDVYIDGISSLLNITYQALDISQVYVETLNEKVQASGGPVPEVAVPTPYAAPKGYSQDITDWLAARNGTQAAISKERMFRNINIPGAHPGTVIAAQSYSEPDYAFNWVRDSALTMDVVRELYSSGRENTQDTHGKILFQYAEARAGQQNDPGLATGLGEPKFYLNNSIFTGPWGRPQNDGPATAAITLLEFANEYLANGGDLETVKSKIWDSTNHPDTAPVQKDLLFVANNWTSPSFDLWEEEPAAHFYTRMVQRRALILGIDFAKKIGDNSTASTLNAALGPLTASFDVFYDDRRNLILYEYGPVLLGKSSYKDIAVVLAVLHGYADDDFFSYSDDRVLASAYQVATSFLPIYGVANVTEDAEGRTLGLPIGRYPEDVYNGTGSTLGNPWYLTTNAIAELFYNAISELQTFPSIEVSNTSVAFWNYFSPLANDQKYQDGQNFTNSDPQYSSMIESLKGWADAFVRRVKYHTPADGSLAEEYNRNGGSPQGAKDLTWSYASIITTGIARANAMGEEESWLDAIAAL